MAIEGPPPGAIVSKLALYAVEGPPELPIAPPALRARRRQLIMA